MSSKRPRATLVAFICVSLVLWQKAMASSLQDDLTRCIVSHVTPADEDVVVQWTFGLMALSPKIRPYTAMTDAQHAAITQSRANLHTRLITKDCRSEAILVLKEDGELGLAPSLRTLGGTAMRALLATPEAHASVLASAKLYTTTPQMDALRAEAGLPPNSK